MLRSFGEHCTALSLEKSEPVYPTEKATTKEDGMVLERSGKMLAGSVEVATSFFFSAILFPDWAPLAAIYTTSGGA